MELTDVDIHLGERKKPPAVVALQVAGLMFIVLGGLLLALAWSLHWEWFRVYLIGIVYLMFSGVFALIGGWRRPPGLVAGIIALALMLLALPFGPIAVAIVGFLGVKDRERVRDYYAPGAR